MWMRCAMISLGLAITFVQMNLHQIGLCFLRVEELVTHLTPAIEGILCILTYNVLCGIGSTVVLGIGLVDMG